MKTVISVAFLLACVFPLDAQITTTLNHLPDGMDEVRIRNNSAISVAAFAAAGKWVTRGAASLGALLRTDGRTAEVAPGYAAFVVYSDPLIEPGARSAIRCRQ